jgi:hypothetical protein
MTTLEDPICWAVFAPLQTADLDRIAEHEWNREFPFAIDPPPWETVSGNQAYNALISREPGSEGSDRVFAKTFSKLARGKTVYSLWFDIDRRRVFEWKNGREVSSREEAPESIAESLGFTVAGSTTPPDDKDVSAVVVVDASLDEVRRALGEFANADWLHLAQGPVGVLITASDGPLGTQAWDVAEALPSAIVYFVQRRPEDFSVLVLRGSNEVGRFRTPGLDDDTPMLPDIRGARTVLTILSALGIPPGALGLD